MNQKLISIITIVYNGETEIVKTIESVASQKTKDVEYIIIDGKSTDNTMKEIQKYSDKIDLLISEKDDGIYDAINKGISLATGELIGIIHSGDYYAKEAIEFVRKEFMKSKADVIYGDVTIINEIDNNILFILQKANHRFLKKRMSLFHPSSFITKKSYQKYGAYNLEYKIAADYELFMRYLKNGLSFSYIPQNLAFFKIGGISTTKVDELIKENIKIKKQYNGRFDAFKFKYKKLVLNTLMRIRRTILIGTIGKDGLNKIRIKRLKERAIN